MRWAVDCRQHGTGADAFGCHVRLMRGEQRLDSIPAFDQPAMRQEAVHRHPALASRTDHGIDRREGIGAQDFRDGVIDAAAAEFLRDGFDRLQIGIHRRLLTPLADQMQGEGHIVEKRAAGRHDLGAFLQRFPRRALRLHHVDQRLGVLGEAFALHALRLQVRIEAEGLRGEPFTRNRAHGIEIGASVAEGE